MLGTTISISLEAHRGPVTSLPSQEITAGGDFTNHQRSIFNLRRCSEAKRVVYE